MHPSLEGLWRGLEERKAALLGDLAALSAEALGFRPAPDAWSLAEVAHHLFLVEKTIADHLGPGGGADEAPLRRPLKKRLLYAAVTAVLKTGIRVKIPTRRVQPEPEPSLPDLAASWDELRRGLGQAIGEIPAERLDRQLIRHPIAGPLNARESLLFLVRHFDHHLRQVARIRRAPGFPAAAA